MGADCAPAAVEQLRGRWEAMAWLVFVLHTQNSETGLERKAKT